MPDPSLQALTKLRAAKLRQEQAVVVAAKRRRDAAERLQSILATGATPERLSRARNQLAAAEREVAGADRQLNVLAERLINERVGFDRTLVTPEAGIKQLSTDHPVLLAPVRIETRFFHGELRVRIFPDVVHIDGHETALTDDERRFAVDYWKRRWSLSTGAESEALWQEVVGGRPPARVAWVVGAMTPTNVDKMGEEDPSFPRPSERPPGPSRAPVARAMPSRWLVTGIRNGATVVRKWGGIVPDDLPVGLKPDLVDADQQESGNHSEVPDQQETLPFDDAIAWLSDYDRAVKVGMAVTIGESDLTDGRVADGFDELIVVGVDWTRTPAQAQADLDALLTAQAHTRGLSFVPAGTATNADADSLPPPPRPPGDPSMAITVNEASAAHRFAAATGADQDLAGRLAGADEAMNPFTEAMHTALWEPTIGYFLRQWMDPLVPETDVSSARDHFRRWVRPRGPLPTVRVGSQPYGILPVMSPNGYAGDPFDETVHGLLTRMRWFWAYDDSRFRRLGHSGDPSEDLVELLGRRERSSTVRMRQAFGSGYASTIAGLDQRAAIQRAVAIAMMVALGANQPPRIADLYVHGEEKVLPIALVQPQPVSEADPLVDNYLSAIRSLLGTRGGIEPLEQRADTASSLLEALLAHAGSVELSRAGLILVLDLLADNPATIPLATFIADQEITVAADDGELFNPVLTDDGRQLPESGLELRRGTNPDVVAEVEALLAMPPRMMIDSTVNVADFDLTIADRLTTLPIPELGQRVYGAQLAEFRLAVDALSNVPSAELQRLCGETLDVVSHRIDAWCTSLADKRLHELRDDRPDGVHLGAFGWVENLKPRTRPPSAGFVHAPSVAHATTAAVLRSGHLSHGAAGVDGDDDWLAIDLDSRRVRIALELLDGVRSGQPVGALLGYRFERGLRDLGVDFARYIHDFRGRFPLDERADRPDGSEPVEAAGVGDVVDGSALAELAQSEITAAFDQLDVAAGHRNAVRALIGTLADAIDAVGDLLVAESVHQAVLGNRDRAAAALDALDRQLAIPDIDLVTTPRTGRGFTHRVLSLLTGDASGWPTDTRAKLAPELNDWTAAVLGGPDNYRFIVEGVDADGVVVQSIEVALSDLGLSPLSAVLATRRGNDQATELEHRVNAHIADLVADDVVRLQPGVAAGGDRLDQPVDLAEFVWRANRIIDFLASSRSATARDFVTPDAFSETGEAVVLTVAQSRATGAVDAITDAESRLSAIDDGSSITSIRSALRRAADLGFRGAVALGDKAQLRRQVDALMPLMEAAVAAVNAIGTTIDTNPRQEQARCSAILRAVLGEDVPVVFPITVPASVAAQLAESSAGQPMQSVRQIEAPDFLFQHSLVRPGLGRLQAVLDDAATLDRTDPAVVGVSRLVVAQLPHVVDDPWIAQPLDTPGRYPAGRMSLLIHDPRIDDGSGKLDLGGRVAALVADQWAEYIPHPSETTGVGFHYDAPGARPPQSMLLAVPADRSEKNWSSEQLVDTVREALALSKLRMLDLDDIGASRLLPATYVPFSLERLSPSIDFGVFLPLAMQALLAAQHESEDD